MVRNYDQFTYRYKYPVNPKDKEPINDSYVHKRALDILKIHQEPTLFYQFESVLR